MSALVIVTGVSGSEAAGAATVTHSIAFPSWSGFMLENAKSGNVTAVHGSWIVPIASCSPGETSNSAEWVGLGGTYVSLLQKALYKVGAEPPYDNKNPNFETLYQTGIDVSCVKGRQVDNAWEQFYNAEHQNTQSLLLPKNKHVVLPGDDITASVVDDYKNHDTIWAINDKRGQNLVWKDSGSWSTDLRGDHTAECIVEDPQERGGANSKFTDFGSVTFSNCQGSLGSNNLSVTAPSLPKNWNSIQLTMKRGQVIFATTSLNPLTVTRWSAGATAASRDQSATALSPTGLAGIVNAYDTSSNLANGTLNTNLLDEIETGTADEIDAFGFKYDTQADWRTSDYYSNGTAYYPVSHQVIAGAVAYQTSSPALALAVTKSGYAPNTPADEVCPAGGTLFVFQKPSPTSSWKDAFEPTIEVSAAPSLATTAGGYGDLVTSGKGLMTDPATIPAAFAAEYAAFVTSGNLGSLPGSIFGPALPCWNGNVDRMHFETGVSMGQNPAFEIVPQSPNDLIAFRTTNGGALALFSDEWTLTYTASEGGFVSFTNTPGDLGANQLPAGHYSSFTQRLLMEVAVEIPPVGSVGSVPFTVIGTDIGNLADTGVPANGS